MRCDAGAPRCGLPPVRPVTRRAGSGRRHGWIAPPTGIRCAAGDAREPRREMDNAAPAGSLPRTRGGPPAVVRRTAVSELAERDEGPRPRRAGGFEVAAF